RRRPRAAAPGAAAKRLLSAPQARPSKTRSARRGPRGLRLAGGPLARLPDSGRAHEAGIGFVMSVRATQPEAQGAARRRVLRAVSRAPARRLQLRLLPRRQPSR